jgi:8-amino-7-oxononanoate synthase
LGEHGRGVLEEFGVCSSHVIYMGTLGKAAGVSGAFVCADKSFIDWMVQRARPYIYTTAAPPANAHALLTSLEIIEGPVGFAKRTHLRALIQTFKVRMSLAHTKDSNKIDQTLADNPSFALTLAPSSTPIQPLVIGSNEDVLKASKYLFERGVWVTAIRAPTVPKGTARLRITLSAAHSFEQLERLLNLLSDLKTKPTDSFN